MGRTKKIACRNCASARHLQQSARFSPEITCALPRVALTWMLVDCLSGKEKVMTLTIRKAMVLGLMGSIPLPGNIVLVANWRSERGGTGPEAFGRST